MKKLFKDKKILIMGLGLHGGGVGAAKFFCKQGAEVLVTDLKTKEQLKESLEKLKGLKNLPAGRLVKYTLGGHEEKDFLWANLIIKNPDVPQNSPFLKIAEKNKIPVETDVGLFFKLSQAHIIGITGTKGKSTTASLIHHILKKKFKRIFLAGNIGVSPLELLSKIKKGDKVILELSSFELEGLTQSPQIAVITNIMPEHLTRHGTMENYIKAKEKIFKYQTKKDFLVLSNDDPLSQRFADDANAKVVFFSKNIKPEGLKIFGEHNLSNVSAAIEVAKIVEVPQEEIKKALRTFKGVPSRQEFVREVSGVKYYNDTTATMPEAVIVAIKTFSKKCPKAGLLFISGGVSKGSDYLPMAKAIKKRVQKLVLLPGTASDKIKEGLRGYGGLYDASSMQEAVLRAAGLAKKGDVVVLSPGGSSFNLFKNEFDRGNQFVKTVKNLR